ncbi:MAG: GntR family transcriptional regulator, partial [Armatimonadetes bacterium]|nr:GntR family transcriptional regulator [Armatimonadota bacterium]
MGGQTLKTAPVPLALDIYRQLKDSIVTSHLLPGTILREVELSERLGVSRTPLREALRMLKAEGLVELAPHRGAQVAQVSRQDLIDAYEVREWLEPPAAAKAARLVNDDALAAIQAAMEKMPVQPLTHEDAVRAEQADLGFHDLILQSTGNRLVRDLVRQA